MMQSQFQAWRAVIARHVDAWKLAWAEVRNESPVAARDPQTLEFLPAVMEMEESPPSPAGRAILWSIAGVFVVAILWACLGSMDIIAIARGKVIPGEHTKTIQPLEAAVVRAIYVRNGQIVRKGDVLIELDATGAEADTDRLQHEEQTANLEAERLRSLLGGNSHLDAAGADARAARLAHELLRDEAQEFQARRDAARLIVSQRASAIEAARADVTRLEDTVPIVEQRTAAIKKLADEGYATKLQYLEREQERIEKVQELSTARHRLAEQTAALAEARRNLRAIESGFERARRKELAETESRAESLSQEVRKASQRDSQFVLSAPVDGVVQQLAVHTVGGVVTPAQQLMVIVPREGGVEIEAWVENKDIGFVEVGQVAEVKIDAFPFTRYGTIEAKVETVSGDAVPLENVGLQYAARVLPKRWSLPVDGKELRLSPGMTVTVEIKTGRRRLIEFFLSPLLQAGHESLRER